ncbi:MAG: hypothetical protein ACXWRE_00375 [Pseudobdellovibrionaceae bacterium]
MKKRVFISFLLVSIGFFVNAAEPTLLDSWSGHYELANSNCKTGEMILGDKIYYGKSLNIRADLKYSTMRFEVMTENGLLGYGEDFKEVNTGKYLYTNTCFSDGLISRATHVLTPNELKKNYEDLKPFAFCSSPYRVIGRSSAKISMRDSQSNVFYYGCWFKKVESSSDNYFGSNF